MGAGDNEWEPGSGHYPIPCSVTTFQDVCTTLCMSYLLPANLSQSASSHQEVSVVSCLSCLLFAYLFSLLCLCLPGCE